MSTFGVGPKELCYPKHLTLFKRWIKTFWSEMHHFLSKGVCFEEKKINTFYTFWCFLKINVLKKSK